MISQNIESQRSMIKSQRSMHEDLKKTGLEILSWPPMWIKSWPLECLSHTNPSSEFPNSLSESMQSRKKEGRMINSWIWQYSTSNSWIRGQNWFQYGRQESKKNLTKNWLLEGRTHLNRSVSIIYTIVDPDNVSRVRHAIFIDLQLTMWWTNVWNLQPSLSSWTNQQRQKDAMLTMATRPDKCLLLIGDT